MKDVNGKELYEGMAVYDLSIEAKLEDCIPNTIECIDGNIIVLDNGKEIVWKGVGWRVPVAVEC